MCVGTNRASDTGHCDLELLLAQVDSLYPRNFPLSGQFGLVSLRRGVKFAL